MKRKSKDPKTCPSCGYRMVRYYAREMKPGERVWYQCHNCDHIDAPWQEFFGPYAPIPTRKRRS